MTLSNTLYTVADLQGKESQVTATELRDLGDIARMMESHITKLEADREDKP